MIKKKKPRLLSGIRPTGPLHLGHYVGMLENWLNFQDEYECFFLIADYQSLTTYQKNKDIKESIYEIVLDWLSIGLDPNKCTFALQSYIPEHTELFMLLSMIIPLSYIKNNPTLKIEMNQFDKKRISLGFFNYPASQVADILLLRAQIVPVGEDQLPYIELTRKIARKFNKLYGKFFPIPQGVVGRINRLPGIDGKNKMSKSLNNAIYLKDDKATVEQKVFKMYTDPNRIHSHIPGRIKDNPVFTYHNAFNKDLEEVNNLTQRYKKGTVSDTEVKKKLARAINSFLEPIRKKRKYFEQQRNSIEKILIDGSKKEQKIARKTIRLVKKFMGLVY